MELTRPEIVRETTKKIKIIQERLKIAQDRQKSYADSKRREIEFHKGDKVFLKVSPMKGVIRFGKRGKLNPCYVGPFRILERIGPMAYRLALTPDLANIHDVFHVSMLRRYISDSSHILVRPMIEIEKNLSYEERLVRILDRQEEGLRNKVIPLVKIW